MSAEFDPDVRLASDGDCAPSPVWDWELRAALDKVDVPAGLAGRMLAALERPAAGEAVVSLAPSKARPSRRRMLLGALSATALIALISTVILLNRGPGVGSADQLKAEAIASLFTYENATGWNQDLEQASLRAFPWDRWLRHPPLRWRSAKVAGDSAVVYDLADGGAILLVVSTRKNYALPAAPPGATASSGSAGGIATIAWQQPALVYVLAADSRRVVKPESLLKAQRIVQHAAPGPHAFASR